ncbi:hypothetical protein G5I_02727 [Acromyrmex echinatior]|uniref:Ig-like domain-containing protein n=1 Tax=Acromyrmex echinatior TaxID=103372 RepID=F4WB05_ACREC|nr:hypothetical protein G5I_02727 [Acromyrmex echinatior]
MRYKDKGMLMRTLTPTGQSSELLTRVRGSSIKSLDVPIAVRNGTGPVDLTCAYQIDENENGLVIKWFHEAYQIYQWIPPIPPQDIGIIEGIAEYPVENLKNPYSCSMIRLKTVTINMTGEYTLPESNMTIRTYPFNKTHVNLTCVVMGALPRPSLKLYVNKIERNSYESDRGPLTDWYKGNPQTSLDVIVENTLDAAIFECEMSIPETEYKRRERIIYYPSSNRSNVTVNAL